MTQLWRLTWPYYGKSLTTIGNQGRNYGQIMAFMDIMDQTVVLCMIMLLFDEQYNNGP
jgi:hypothetical protein